MVETLEIRRIVFSAILLIALPGISIAQNPSPAAIPSFTLTSETIGRETQLLQGELSGLFDSRDIGDSLGLGWADLPYQRATLAVLHKCSMALEREVELRKAGNGAIDDQTIRRMFHWMREALDVAGQPARRAGFRPDRIRQLSEGEPFGFIGLIDQATSTRNDPQWGDFDVLMCTGVPVYGHGPRPWLADSTRTAMADATREWNRIAVFYSRSTPDDQKTFRISGIASSFPGDQHETRYHKARAQLWTEAYSKGNFLLIEGWRDLRDGSGSSYPSLFTDPQMMELICHTALDMAYCRSQCPSRSVMPILITANQGKEKQTAQGRQCAVLINTSATSTSIPVAGLELGGSGVIRDLLNQNLEFEEKSDIPLQPYQVRFLVRKPV